MQVRPKRAMVWVTACCGWLLGSAAHLLAAENVALRATVSASSEMNPRYAARFACDGKVPVPRCLSLCSAEPTEEAVWMAKVGQSTGALTLEWKEPVAVAEVVYYAVPFSTGLGKYKIYLDDRKEASAEGEFTCVYGPQRVALPSPASASKLTIRYSSSQKVAGAAEVQVYSTSPPPDALGRAFAADQWNAMCPPPPPIEDSPELAAKLRSGALGFDRIVAVKRRPNYCDHVYIYHEVEKCLAPGGGLYVYAADDKGGQWKPLVESADGRIHHLDLSYAGKEVVFSWRKAPQKRFQVYRVGIDGSGLKQLTDGDSHNFDACWLPDGDICFLSTRDNHQALCFGSTAGLLYRMDRDGRNVKRLSYGYLHDFTPAVMDDGRLLFSRWEYVDKSAWVDQSLWTIRPDGAKLEGVYGTRVLCPQSFIEGQQIPGTGRVLCTLSNHCGSGGSIQGAIGMIDPAHGDNAEVSLTNLTPDAVVSPMDTMAVSGVKGPYSAPYPVDRQYFFLSREGTLILRDYEGQQAVIVARPDADGVGFYDARPVRARPRPPVLGAHPTDSQSPEGVFHLQDVYQGLGPVVKRGEVKEICVVEEVPRVARGGYNNASPKWSWAPKRVLGFAKVEEDGSASFKAPAGKSIYFLALDEEGRAVQRMRSITQLMPGEVQGCVGCHEPRTVAAPAGRRLPLSLTRPPQELEPAPWALATFSYLERVQPILDKHCVRCHGAADPPQGIILTGSIARGAKPSPTQELFAKRRTDYGPNTVAFRTPSYLHLTQPDLPRKRDRKQQPLPDARLIRSLDRDDHHNLTEIAPRQWGSCASPLAALILSGHPDADGKKRVDLARAERRVLWLWIDLNVPFFKDYQEGERMLAAAKAGAE